MNKIILSILLSLAIPHAVLADRISVKQAQDIAQNFTAGRLRHSAKVVEKTSANKLQLADESRFHYIFNVNDRGFVVVAADDAAGDNGILGYSDNGRFIKDSIPDAMKAWLREYDKQIEYFSTDTSTKQKAKKTDSEETETLNEIYPLISSQWGQTSPYNQKCPKSGNDNCPAGCFPVAAAQILYYNKWPEKGSGTVRGTDLATHEYQWELMSDTYGENSSKESQDAVATLIADIGAASNTRYTIYGSGTYTPQGLLALKNNFGYKNAQLISRKSDMSADEWIQIIYDELEEKRPVLYCGYSSEGGHAFVADGYRDGYLHINWGWYGSCDGYFKTDAMNPTSVETGYNFSQTVITGLEQVSSTTDPEKPQSNYTKIIGKEDITFSMPVTTSSSLQTIKGRFHIECNKDRDIIWGLEVTDYNNHSYMMKGEPTGATDGQEITEYSVDMSGFPESNGIYTVKPAAWIASSGKRITIMYDSNVNSNMFLVYKKGNMQEFHIMQDGDNAMVTNMKATTLYDNNYKIAASATVNCLGLYLNKEMRFAILDNRGDTLSISDAMDVKLWEGGSANIYTELDAPEFSGEYTAELLYKDGDKLKRFKDCSLTFKYQNLYNIIDMDFYGIVIDGIYDITPKVADRSDTLDLEISCSFSSKTKRNIGLGLKVVDLNGNATYLKPAKYFEVDGNSQGVGDDFSVGLADFPVADGKYYAYLYAYDKDNDMWEPFVHLYGMSSRCFAATAENGKISFEKYRKDVGNINIEYTETPSAYEGQPFNIKLNATCLEYDMGSDLYIGLTDKDNNLHLYKDYRFKPNLEYKESVVINYKPFFAADENITVGEYKVGLYNYRFKKIYPISNLLPLEVKEPVAELRLGGIYIYDKENVDKELLRVSPILNNRNCKGSYRVAVFVYDAEGKELVDSLSQGVQIEKDYTKMPFFAWEPKNLEKGKTYIAKVFCQDNNGAWIPVETEQGVCNGERFKVNASSGISVIPESNDNTLTVYSADGLFLGKYREPLRTMPNGVYIIRRNRKAVKIRVENR